MGPGNFPAMSVGPCAPPLMAPDLPGCSDTPTASSSAPHWDPMRQVPLGLSPLITHVPQMFPNCHFFPPEDVVLFTLIPVVIHLMSSHSMQDSVVLTHYSCFKVPR